VETIARRAVESTDDFKDQKLPINRALGKILRDMQELDTVVGRMPQLSLKELVTLLSTVTIAAASPYFIGIKAVELLVPSMAAVSAAIGISAEYIGKVAVANGKEVAALAIQASAEAEVVLATAERTKAILPLCVGLSTTASAFALLTPVFVSEVERKLGILMPKEIYLLWPLVAVLAASISGLASQESASLCARAAGTGNRRFASSGAVGRTWMSATEQVEAASDRISRKWSSFSTAVFIAPGVAVFFPGPLSFKGTVCAAVAAAQAAYYLSSAEYSLAAATEAVALKSRAAAIADTYANQGSRAGAILPFTSALAGLCAAASAAAVEVLPFIHMVELQSLVAVIFPTGAAFFAAAASVSKARCEVDASAASTAAATGMLGQLREDEAKRDQDPVGNVLDLIIMSIETGAKQVKQTLSRMKAKSLQRYRHYSNTISRFRIKLRALINKLFKRRPSQFDI
jgi:hypothetical protein